MTFIPRIASTLASLSEPSEHGTGRVQGTRHAQGAGESGPHQAGEASPHTSPEAVHAEQDSRADAPALAPGPTKGSGKRASRPGADAAPSFAAELEKNVMSGEREEHAGVSTEDDLLEEEDVSHTPPAQAANAGETEPHAAAARSLFQHVRPGAAEPAAPLPGARHASEPADLPRAVVNGSGETPNSDAMPVSPRLSTGSHVHADVEASPRPYTAERAAPEPTLLAQLTAAVDHAVSGEQPTADTALAAADDTSGPVAANVERASAPATQQSNSRAPVEHRARPVDRAFAQSSAGETPSRHVQAARESMTVPVNESPAPVVDPAQHQGPAQPLASQEFPSQPRPSQALASPPPSPRAQPSQAQPSPAPSSHAPPAPVPSPEALAPRASSFDGPSSQESSSHSVPSGAGLPHAPWSRPGQAPAAPSHPSSDILPSESNLSSLSSTPASAEPVGGPAAPRRTVPSSSPPFAPPPAAQQAPGAFDAPAPVHARPGQADISRATAPVAPPPSRSFARAGAAYAQVAEGDAPAQPGRAPSAAPRSSAPQPSRPTGPAAAFAPSPASPSPSPVQADDHAPPSAAGPGPGAGKVTAPRHGGEAARPPASRPEQAAFPEAVALTVESPSRDSSAVIHPTAGSATPSAAQAHPVPSSPGNPETSPAEPSRASTPAGFRAPAHVALPADASPTTPGPHRQPDAPIATKTSPGAAVASPPVQASAPRRDGRTAPVHGSASPPREAVSPSSVRSEAPAAPQPAPEPRSSSATQVAPAGVHLPRSAGGSPQRAPSVSTSVASSGSSSVSLAAPLGSGEAASGESTAAHPTPLVDPSSANPPLFRLSETRRVQAAHLDLAQQSYQPGTEATSSRSTKGFDTGVKGDKAGKSKKSRPVDFAPNAAPNLTPVAPPSSPPAGVPAPGKARRSDESTGGRAGRGEREDAIHALTAGGATPGAAPLIQASPGTPHVRAGAPIVDGRDDRFSVAAPVARDPLADVSRDTQRPGDAARSAAPASDTRPAQQPAPGLTPDKAPPPAPQAAHAPPAPAAAATVAPAPQVPAAAQPLYDLASADHSLQATALGKNAHLHLETGAAGPVSLHLTVRDGVADLEVEGPGAERLEMRPEELRRALAGEGLTLGHFAARVTETSDTRTQQDPARDQGGQNQGNGERAGQPDQAPRPTATPFTAQSGASSYGGEGRRHWQNEAPDAAERDHRPGAAPTNGAASSSTSDAPPSRRRGVHVTA